MNNSFYIFIYLFFENTFDKILLVVEKKSNNQIIIYFNHIYKIIFQLLLLELYFYMQTQVTRVEIVAKQIMPLSSPC